LDELYEYLENVVELFKKFKSVKEYNILSGIHLNQPKMGALSSF